MAKNNRDRLIETFISRSRNTRVPQGYRPVKQGTLISKVPGASGQAPRDLTAAREDMARQAARARKRNRRIARY